MHGRPPILGRARRASLGVTSLHLLLVQRRPSFQLQERHMCQDIELGNCFQAISQNGPLKTLYTRLLIKPYGQHTNAISIKKCIQVNIHKNTNIFYNLIPT